MHVKAVRKHVGEIETIYLSWSILPQKNEEKT
jgi:hypothetical protein